jgi:hypothetical protein
MQGCKFIKLLGFFVILSTIAFPQGGKLSFSRNKVYRFDKTTYKDTLKLIELSGAHGLKALQFRLIFRKENPGVSLIEFKNLSKGKNIDTPEWSLQYNIKSQQDNSPNIIVCVLLYNLSTSELPPGTYNDLINFEYELKNLARLESYECKIELSEIQGSWFDGSDAKIVAGNNQLLYFVKKNEHIVKKIKLTNYPNPFNPETIIRCEIPDDNLEGNTPVSLKIFDILGIEMATLFEGKKEPGIFEVRFDGSDYPSGIYLYTLTAGAYTETRKFVIMR